MRVRLFCRGLPWFARDANQHGGGRFIGDFEDARKIVTDACDAVGVEPPARWCGYANDNDTLADYMGHEPGGG